MPCAPPSNPSSPPASPPPMNDAAARGRPQGGLLQQPGYPHALVGAHPVRDRAAAAATDHHERGAPKPSSSRGGLGGDGVRAVIAMAALGRPQGGLLQQPGYPNAPVGAHPVRDPVAPAGRPQGALLQQPVAVPSPAKRGKVADRPDGGALRAISRVGRGLPRHPRGGLKPALPRVATRGAGSANE